MSVTNAQGVRYLVWGSESGLWVQYAAGGPAWYYGSVKVACYAMRTGQVPVL